MQKEINKTKTLPGKKDLGVAIECTLKILMMLFTL